VGARERPELADALRFSAGEDKRPAVPAKARLGECEQESLEVLVPGEAADVERRLLGRQRSP
jgi:hypothetical protein